jgi:hypothetical protein
MSHNVSLRQKLSLVTELNPKISLGNSQNRFVCGGDEKMGTTVQYWALIDRSSPLRLTCCCLNNEHTKRDKREREVHCFVIQTAGDIGISLLL